MPLPEIENRYSVPLRGPPHLSQLLLCLRSVDLLQTTDRPESFFARTRDQRLLVLLIDLLHYLLMEF